MPRSASRGQTSGAPRNVVRLGSEWWVRLPPRVGFESQSVAGLGLAEDVTARFKTTHLIQVDVARAGRLERGGRRHERATLHAARLRLAPSPLRAWATRGAQRRGAAAAAGSAWLLLLSSQRMMRG